MNDAWNAMADVNRRQILTMLKEKDMTAGEIAECFSLSKATISHHLSILKEAGLIVGQKRAQTITYQLNTTVFQDFLKGVAGFFSKEEEK